jgi:DNA invertase Pin-like site-specific DNA recombinase
MMIGYARVSTEQQETEVQLPELRKAGCKRVYEETVGGGSMDRPELVKCLERLDKGDTLVVWRLDRLGRSIRDLLQIVDRLDKSGINFISLKERFDTSTAAGRLVFHFFAALTQFEKELIRERTIAGLSSARARGRLGGRKKVLTVQQTRVVNTMWDSREHTRHEIAAHFTVSVATIDRVLKASRIVAAGKGEK